MSEQTEVLAESKQSMVVAFLKSEESKDRSNAEVAAMFGCNEGTVRRSRKIVEAEYAAHQMIARGSSGEEAKDVLRAILAADSFTDELRASLEECKQEQAEIKALIKDAEEKSRAVRRQAQEQFPLFDRHAVGGTQLALTA